MEDLLELDKTLSNMISERATLRKELNRLRRQISGISRIARFLTKTQMANYVKVVEQIEATTEQITALTRAISLTRARIRQIKRKKA